MSSVAAARLLIVVLKRSTPSLSVRIPLKVLFVCSDSVPVPALVRLPVPEIIPALVMTKPLPTLMVPSALTAKVLVNLMLARGATVAPLLVKVTAPLPNDELLLIAKVPAFSVVPPAYELEAVKVVVPAPN